jgi:hypothetical protein
MAQNSSFAASAAMVLQAVAQRCSRERIILSAPKVQRFRYALAVDSSILKERKTGEVV